MRVWLIMVLLGVATAALADYKSDYRDGVAAAERQEWDKVDTLMRRAIAQEPNPQGRVRVQGKASVPYVPQFYLALSAFARNDCKSALALLEDPKSAGAPGGQRLEERRQIMLRSCRARLASAAQASPPAAPTGPALASTPPAVSPKPAPPAPVKAAVAAPPAAPAPAAGTPVDALKAQAAVADARTALETALRQGADQLASTADRASAEAMALSQALAQGKADLGSAQAAPLQAAARSIESASRALDAAQARGALAGQIRARLQPLAEAYFSGDFARAATWADEPTLQAVPQAHAQALLLRAAARHELYVLGGERDLQQLEQIREDIRAARRLAGRLTPAETAYSPRFRALFASTR